MKYRHFIKTTFLQNTGIEDHCEGRLFNNFVFRDGAVYVEINFDKCVSDLTCLKYKQREIMLDINHNVTGKLIEPLSSPPYGTGDPWPMQRQMKRLVNPKLHQLRRLQKREVEMLRKYRHEHAMHGYVYSTLLDELKHTERAIAIIKTETGLC